MARGIRGARASASLKPRSSSMTVMPSATASEAHAPHTEVKLGQKVLNAMTELGRPVFERIS